MSQPFEGGSDQISYGNIDRKIWRNYKIALGLGATVLALGYSMLVTYRALEGDSPADITYLQPASTDFPEQLAELYRQSP